MYYLLYIYREVHQREEKLPQKKPSMSLGRQSLYHVHLLTITVDQVPVQPVLTSRFHHPAMNHLTVEQVKIVHFCTVI